jgi:hypothetical protein
VEAADICSIFVPRKLGAWLFRCSFRQPLCCGECDYTSRFLVFLDPTSQAECFEMTDPTDEPPSFVLKDRRSFRWPPWLGHRLSILVILGVTGIFAILNIINFFAVLEFSTYLPTQLFAFSQRTAIIWLAKRLGRLSARETE